MAGTSTSQTGFAGNRLLLLLVSSVLLSVAQANNCSWGSWTTGCGSDCLQRRNCICGDTSNSSTSGDCSGPANRSCCSSGTPSQTTPTMTSTSTPRRTSAANPTTNKDFTTMPQRTLTVISTKKGNRDSPTQAAAGSDDGSDAKTLVAIIAPIGTIVFFALLAVMLVVIWRKRKNSVITVTRPIPEDKRRKFHRVSEPDSPDV